MMVTCRLKYSRIRWAAGLFLIALLCLFFYTPLRAESLLDEAVKLFKEGRWEEAGGKFQQLLDQDPTGAEALYYLGKLEGDADKSLEYRQRFLSLHPQHPWADQVLYGVAQYNFALGYYLTAAKEYHRLIRSYPQSELGAEALFWLASSKLAIGAADSADHYFRHLLETHGQSDMAIWSKLGRADASYMAQNFSQAKSRCRNFLDEHPNSPLVPVALFRMAEIQDAQGERAEATVTLQKLVNDYAITYQATQAQRKLTEWGWTDHKKGAPEIEIQAGRYTVQVGAFSKRANANNLETQLSSWGYQVEVVKRAGRHRTLYLVWVGSYESREEAVQEGQALENDRGLPNQIISR